MENQKPCISQSVNTSQTLGVSIKTSKEESKTPKFAKIFRNMSSGAFCFIFLIVMVLSGSIDYACKHTYTAQKQWIVLAVGLFVFAIVVVIGLLVKKYISNSLRTKLQTCLQKKKTFILWITVGSILLLLLQCYIVYGGWFQTGWDIWFLTHPIDNDPDPFIDYLSRYPNQLFLYDVFYIIAKISPIFGIESGYLACVLGGCLCVTLAIWFCSYAAKSIFGYLVGYATFIVSFFLAGLSPWILVPYSDAYGMLCPSIVLFCYCALDKCNAKWIFISFFGLLGYFIKPTAILVVLAILFIELFSFISGRIRKKRKSVIKLSNIKKLTTSATFFILGFVLAFGVYTVVNRFTPELNPNKAFSITHFLMMGANEERRGVYSGKDVTASMACPNKTSRQEMNIRVWKNRLNEMGFLRLGKQGLKKTLTNFADGTFAWANEGDFWVQVNGSNQLILNFYGIGNFSCNADGSERAQEYGNANARVFQNTSQIIWLMILLGVSLGFIKKDASKGEVVAYLSILALAIFLTIFECRARYLYLYLPFFIMLGCANWAKISSILLQKVSKRPLSKTIKN